MISKKVLAGVVVRKEWTPEDIRNLCIDRGLYTKGTKEEYESMLQYVASHNPFSLDIEYTVARDILDHTDPETNQTIENIMFLNEDMSKSWSYRVGAAEKYVHRCTDTDCADISTLLVPVPNGMTIHGLYKCIRYGLQHKAEAMAEEDPVPPQQKGE